MRSPEEKELIETRITALNVALELTRGLSGLDVESKEDFISTARAIEAYILEKPADKKET